MQADFDFEGDDARGELDQAEADGVELRGAPR